MISGSLLIAGTAIGAGMLGIPLVTSQCGFFPASIVTIAVWLFMLLTGLLLLRATLWMPTRSSFLSIARHFLGKPGEFVTGAMFVFLYYCLMVAYFAAGSHLLSYLVEWLWHFSLNTYQSNGIFALIFFTIVSIGPKSIDRVNIGLSLLMFASWIILLLMGSREVNFDRLEMVNLNKMWPALPLLFGAFGYHNIIPSITHYLGRNQRALIASIVIGTTIPLIVYLFWQWLIIGALPLQVIQTTMQDGLPITFALESIAHNPKIVLLGQLFALFAITTSVLGVSFSLVDFLADGFKVIPVRWNRIGLCLLTFFPPFILSTMYPTIFEKALSIAGGFGEAILNGLLPISLVYIGKYSYNLKTFETVKGGKLLLLILTLFSLLVMGIEIIHLYTIA